ncbi:MAG: hypothetical protein QOI20_2923 [Acidimicrobiaceae bacterium]|jgi:dipeptidyl aminopeptidase/acylaminoacyl peptidase|nr:hypothetical protein [Acidimicrobiaceae bacterium]
MCIKGRTIANAALSPDGTTVAFGAGDRLITVPAEGGPERVVAFDPAPGAFAWTADGRALAYAANDRICAVPATGGPGRTLLQADGPITGFALAADGRIAHVVDHRVVHVDGTALPGTADFVFDPTWSPDGRTLVWHEWDVPDMPWDAGRIVAWSPESKRVATVAGGDGFSVQQPRFSPAGSRLAFLSDATGWLNVWMAGPDGSHARPVLDEPFEHADPAWWPGQRSYCWSPDGTALVLNRNEGGFGRLVRIGVPGTGAPGAPGTPVELRKGVHRSLSWAGPHVAALRSGARTPTEVVVDRTTVAVGPVGGFEPALVEPEPVEWRGHDGGVIHGRLFRAGAAVGRAAPGGNAPLIVQIHGGPTGQNQVVFDAKTSFWLDRGWAVLVPDFRGSTGWGREYQQALRGRWGELDTADVAAGMQAAADNGWADARRMVPMGGSSGGMTVLLLLALHPELCAAGVASYPVVDLADLARSEYRFEAHYTHSLIGPFPATRKAHRDRSPLAHIDRITKPLLVFHGTADEVVPVRQSRKLVRRLRDRGADVEHVEYEGEGHGFRGPAHVGDQLRRTEAWLAAKVLGFPQ